MTEVRLALRMLTKAPVFTAVAVLSLALGIGANTAMFGLVDQILLRLLPVRNPRELVQLRIDGGRYVEGQLFGVKAGDPAVFGASAAALLFASLLAGSIPAWRASRIDPIRALRCD